MKAHIVGGNTKLQGIPNDSSMPVDTCPPWVKAFCGRWGECYAFKALRYKNVRIAWRENTRMIRANLPRFERSLCAYLEKKRPAYYRAKCAGDEVTRAEFKMRMRVALKFPGTRFLIFTKRYEWIPANVPANVQIILSIWEGMNAKTVPAYAWKAYKRVCRRFPKAYLGNCSNFRGFKDAVKCHGQCDQCGVCWYASESGINVRFTKH